jgi:hypothetical protein
MTAYLRFVYPYFQLWSKVICVLLLLEGILLEKIAVALSCPCGFYS